jgi:hypothetical protein
MAYLKDVVIYAESATLFCAINARIAVTQRGSKDKFPAASKMYAFVFSLVFRAD